MYRSPRKYLPAVGLLLLALSLGICLPVSARVSSLGDHSTAALTSDQATLAEMPLLDLAAALPAPSVNPGGLHPSRFPLVTLTDGLTLLFLASDLPSRAPPA